MPIRRDLLDRIGPFLKRKEFLAIVGPRQAGKTIFLELLGAYLNENLHVPKERIQNITFEDRRLLAEFERDPVPFIQSYLPTKVPPSFTLMIDEFQYAREGGQKLKLIYDTVPGIKVIVTGSSSLELKAQVGRYMVGRILNFNLWPFHFGEILRARSPRLERVYDQRNESLLRWLKEGKPVPMTPGPDGFREEMRPLFEEYCIWGGYPAVVLSEGQEERKKVLAEIYNNYILKDIKTLLELATEEKLYRLAQVLATQIGDLVVYQHLSQASDLDYRNLKKHLTILTQTFITQQLRPFFKNRQKELVKNPKIFFLDLGFRNTLTENMNRLTTRPDAGAMVENAVWIRLHGLFEGTEKINFWRTKAGAEVDFVLHLADRLLPMEVKYSPSAGEKLPRGLASFIEQFHPPAALVLTKDSWGRMKRGKTSILFAPVYYL